MAPEELVVFGHLFHFLFKFINHNEFLQFAAIGSDIFDRSTLKSRAFGTIRLIHTIMVLFLQQHILLCIASWDQPFGFSPVIA